MPREGTPVLREYCNPGGRTADSPDDPSRQFPDHRVYSPLDPRFCTEVVPWQIVPTAALKSGPSGRSALTARSTCAPSRVRREDARPARWRPQPRCPRSRNLSRPPPSSPPHRRVRSRRQQSRRRPLRRCRWRIPYHHRSAPQSERYSRRSRTAGHARSAEPSSSRPMRSSACSAVAPSTACRSPIES